MIVNAIVALPLAAVLNLWQDEAYTLHTIGGTLPYAYHEALSFEQNAPLYFVVMNLWHHLGSSIFFGRFFSVMCTLFMLALVPRVVSRYLPGVSGGLVTLAVALNPFTLYAELEMRAYAMIVLISVLLLLTFYDAFLEMDGRGRLGATAVYVITVIAALYTQYYLGFLVAAQGIALLFYARRSIPRFLASALTALLAFLPVALVLPAQMRNFQGGFTAPDSPAEAAHTVVRILGQYVLPLHPFGRTPLAYCIATAAVVTAACMLAVYFSRHGRSIAIVISAIGIGLLSLGLYVEQIHVLNRHLAPFFVPSILSVFAGTTFLRSPVRPAAAVAVTCVSALFSIITLVATYHSFANPGDWARVAAYVRERESPGEPIAVFEGENALPFAYYYHGPNRIDPIPAAVDYDTYDVRRFVVRSERQLARAFPTADAVWLVSGDQCYAANIDFGCDIVESYIAKHYRVAAAGWFYGSSARLLVKRRP